MHLASSLSSPDPVHADRRRRILSLVLTIVAHLLLLLMLLRLAPPFAKMAKSGGQLLVFSTAPDAQEDATKSPAKAKSERAATAPPLASVPPPKIELPDKAAPWVLTPGLEKFDVRQAPVAQPARAPSDASASDEANGDSNSDRPVAYGPGGQPLYAAQWYREPTEAELAYYLKKARPGAGYAEVGCQTIARFHVANCFPMSESLGSGLGRAMIDASWQLLVVPPRIGGRAQVGAWVIIRFTFTEQKVMSAVREP